MEVKSKICFKCGEVKDITEFYKHEQMLDGYLNKCKICTKSDSSKNRELKILDPNFVLKERDRTRNRNRRLNYTTKYKKVGAESSALSKKYREKHPEKYKATNAAQRLSRKSGCHNHHWSYNEEHWRDVISIDRKLHQKAHRFLVYDKDFKMYRRSDTLELLDTKEKHAVWINHCIENEVD